jgi:DNA polymerase-1
MLRTVQLGLEDGTAFVIEFTSSKETVLGYEMYQAMDNPVKAWAALKRLLEDPLVKIVGQNVKEDGLWLMNHGIDIRPNVVWDTMLAESLLNQAGPFGLEELALKYTDIPRWSLELEQWKKEAGGLWHRGGYGFVPPSILNPYAGLDVIATMAVFMKQAAMIEMEEYMEPRGQYPSLFKSVMNLQNALYEIERTGLPVDTEMLDKMIGLFEPKVDKMRDAIIAEAVKLGCSPDFNPGSSDDVTDLLFKRLGITPFKSTKATGGKLWQDAIRNLSVDEVDAIECIGASTDAISLTILADKHALVQKLLDYNRVSQIRKTWLRTPELDGTGGLYGVLGPDKRLHPSLSLLTQTGRLRSARPNSQNFPKKAQKFLDDIFREELETLPWLKDYGGVPSVRQIVVPPEGWVIMEADFIQAELFTMAALSNDDRMWATLTTPGMDLHDKTAIDGFGLEILDADGHPLKQERILDQAADFWKQFGGGTTDFKKKLYEDALDSVLGKLTYVEQSGNKMSRKEFKKSLRVSAKAINFGSASKR